MDKKKTLQRFLKKTVRQGDCLIWKGGKGNSGYGTFFLNGKNRNSHRVSYQLHHGEIPTGKVVMHTCDNRLCVEPAHLRLGTHAENSADMLSKSRHRVPTGCEHPNAKITPEIAAEIRRRYKPYSRTDGSSALAREFGLSQPAVHTLIRGETWRE